MQKSSHCVARKSKRNPGHFVRGISYATLSVKRVVLIFDRGIVSS